MKKLQVFISSTYTDLKIERQAAVEAVLETGHIPAGMELFAADNKSQLDIIRKWIDESDIYLLILGGRYGSIDQETKKSYTQLEYEYALGKKIPLFAVFISEEALKEKISLLGKEEAQEQVHVDQYNAFKNLVLSKMCKKYNDVKDIKLSISQTLAIFKSEYNFDGWVSGKSLKMIDQREKRVLKQINDHLPSNLLIRGFNGGPINPTVEIRGIVSGFKELELFFGNHKGILRFGLHPHGSYQFMVIQNHFGNLLNVVIPEDFTDEHGFLTERYVIQASTYDFNLDGIDYIIIAIGSGTEGQFWIYSYTEVSDVSKINPFTLELTSSFQRNICFDDNQLIIPIGYQGLYESFYWFNNAFFQKVNSLYKK